MYMYVYALFSSVSNEIVEDVDRSLPICMGYNMRCFQEWKGKLKL